MIQVGQTLPKGIILKKIADGAVQDFSTDALFEGKYILFAVPGAFTPTCSNQHLPSYIAEADALKAKGIKEIFCLAVNDHFVIKAWADAQHASGKVALLADGSGVLTQALGMALDVTAFGLGTRSKRYSMVIDNGVVTALNMEENPGECRLTNASEIHKMV